MTNSEIKQWIENLDELFAEHSNPEMADGMKAYMKNKFAFAGIKSPLRKEITKNLFTSPLLKNKLHSFTLIEALWEKEEREYQYCAIELMAIQKKKLEKNDIKFIEDLLLNKSWWDSVDMLNNHAAGPYFLKFPEQKNITDNWNKDENLWLRRSSIIFQLTYKQKTNVELLQKYIEALSSSNEFFIKKAIGWALRAYSKVNPQWVKEFIASHAHTLSRLSISEGSKYI